MVGRQTGQVGNQANKHLVRQTFVSAKMMIRSRNTKSFFIKTSFSTRKKPVSPKPKCNNKRPLEDLNASLK